MKGKYVICCKYFRSSLSVLAQRIQRTTQYAVNRNAALLGNIFMTFMTFGVYPRVEQYLTHRRWVSRNAALLGNISVTFMIFGGYNCFVTNLYWV